MPRQGPLGPLQSIFDQWTPVLEEVQRKPHGNFKALIDHQVEEVFECLAAGEAVHAAKEVVDIISVALNWLRNMGWDADQIAALMLARAYDLKRKGGGNSVLETYRLKFGL